MKDIRGAESRQGVLRIRKFVSTFVRNRFNPRIMKRDLPKCRPAVLLRPLALLLLGLAITSCGETARPLHPKAEGVTRLVTYNVGVFSKYLDGGSYAMIADMMREIDADAVAMNELDSCTVRTGGIFQLQRAADLLGGWDCNYGAAMPFSGGAYGEGIASRERPVRSFSVVMERGEGAEPRVLVVSEFARYVYATTHLDHVSAAQRAVQAETINRIMMREYGASPKPVFLGGDLNDTPDSEPLRILRKAWKILTPAEATFSSHDPQTCIDYILQLDNGAACEVLGARVLKQFRTGDVRQASDHLPVLLDVRLPER